MFALVDCNNFYASCERVFRPDLVGKPVVVLSNNDGCVIARSEEAKTLGIPMAAPAFQFEETFQRKGIFVFSANFALYGDMSSRVMEILSHYSPEMEIYSIDEAFLKLDGMTHFDLKRFALEIRSVVFRWTGIPISIGIAKTKSLAKVANRIAKKEAAKNGGVYLIDTEEKRIEALKRLDVAAIWGIGRRLAGTLKAKRVFTAYEFLQLDDGWTKKHLTISGLKIKRDLAGEPSIDLDVLQPRKSIATTRSFDSSYTQFEQLKERIATFSVLSAEKLRRQRSLCRNVMVFLHTNGHRKDLPQYGPSTVVKLPVVTDSSIELSRVAIDALREIFREGYDYKKAGVVLLDLVTQANFQPTLFDSNDARHAPLMRAIDHINERYGQQKIRLGSQNLHSIWKMRQRHLSPRYTTKLEEIITVHV